MKTTRLFMLVCTGMLVLHTGCSENDLMVEENASSVGKEKITLTAVTQASPSQTRTAHTYNGEGVNTISVTWTEDDAFYLFDTQKNQGESFTLDSGSGSILADFTGSLPDGATSFNAFYPASKAAGKTWQECELDIRRQVQTGNADMSHLSAYNFMTLKEPEGITADMIGQNTLVFCHEVAIFRIKVTLPEAKTPVELVLQTDYYPDRWGKGKGGFVTVCNVNDSDNNNLSSSVALTLENITSSTFVAYIAMLPREINGSITYNVCCDDNTVYTHTQQDVVSGWNIEAGYVYKGEISPVLDEAASQSIFYNNMIADNSWSGKGELSNPYRIASAAQLKSLVDQVENGKDFSGEYFDLETNIQVVSDEWIPIGIDSSAPFRGHFDGNEHYIQGTLEGSNECFGFFGYIDGGSVSKLDNEADVECESRTPEYVGGIAGYSASPIQNCTNSGTVSSSYAVSSGNNDTYIGGITGYAVSPIRDCKNSGEVTVSSVGSNSYAGGIAGFTSSSIIKCTGSGRSSATAVTNAYAGCIGGYIGTTGKLHQNEGTGSFYATGINAYKGGLAGYNAGTIYNCNTGSAGSDLVGGGNQVSIGDAEGEHQ